MENLKIKYFVFFGIFLICKSHLAQTNADTVFFTKKWERTVSNENVAFYGFKDYNENEAGIATYYLSDGTLYSKQYEVKNSREGKCEWFHENGKLRVSGEYKKDKPIGEITYYDISGIFVRTEIYGKRKGLEAVYYYAKNGKKVFAECDRFSSFGKYRNEDKAFEKMGDFINENIERISSIDLDGDGKATVYVSFLVAPSGQIEDIMVTQSANPIMDAALIKVVKQMPNWRPAKYKKEKVYSEFSIGYTF